MSSVASSTVASPSPADATSSPLTSLGPLSSGILSSKHGIISSSPGYSFSSKIISLPTEIHRLIILSLVELPNRIYLHQSQEDVYLANQELITLSQVSKAYKDLSYPILYEEIVVKNDRALARFFKTIQLYPELKLRVRAFWPIYWYSHSVASPYFLGEFPRLEELSLRNDLRLLRTNYDLNFQRYSVEDEEDGLDAATIEAVDEEESDDEAYEGKGKGKVAQRLMTPGGAGGGAGLGDTSTPEVAIKREKARKIAKALKQFKKRQPKRLSMSTVVKLKTLEITMNGLSALPATNVDLEDVETLSIHWVPKPAQDFKTPLPKLKTLYLSTHQIIQDREYEPQLLRLLELYGPQLRHLHFAFRGIDDHVPSATTVSCPNLLTMTITSPYFYSYLVHFGHPTIEILRFGLPVSIVPLKPAEEGLFDSSVDKMVQEKWPKLKEMWCLELDWDEEEHRAEGRVESWEVMAENKGWTLLDHAGRKRIGERPSVVEKRRMEEAGEEDDEEEEEEDEENPAEEPDDYDSLIVEDEIVDLVDYD